MSKSSFSFDDNRVTVGGSHWETPIRILDGVQIGDLIILVLDWTPLSEDHFGQVQNLRAYTNDGMLVWKAEHPTNMTSDCYTNIINLEPLVAGNFAGYSCRIDPRDGRLLESVFTK